MSDDDDLDDKDTQTAPLEIHYAAREREDDELYPNRPRNHSPTLPFHTLYQDLFDPLIENNKKDKQTPRVNTRRFGPKAINSSSTQDRRDAIIENYISRWRRDVGNDFYPAMRLILPDKDKDRAMYGLKEKILAKHIIKILKIDKNSEDGYNLLNWKQPGLNIAAKKAGDFPGRVHQVLAKRPFRTEAGNMTIEEVNQQLDELSKAAKEEQQLPLIEKFYRQMNPEELKWLVSIILRTMHIGATEKTILTLWHRDAGVMFNISSSLKRVCWELWNSSIRLESEASRGLTVGQCFQPQLAQFQPKKMDQYVKKLGVTEEDPEFWIEEKLDGERMALHTWIVREKQRNDSEYEPEPPYRIFKFWSRKAKDYSYLYGEYLDGPNEKCGFTRHLKNAFAEGVDSVILDGEMITWNPETDKIIPFGTLKSAALEQQRNPYSNGDRPLYKVFDILYLNGQDLISYNLRERRHALETVVKPVDRRIEILDYTIGHTWEDIERALRKVVAEASEGLVVKNPRSAYILNARNDDWIKVKPEYMEEFGESLDCLIIGGYYGSGKRGGGLSSFLCGLRSDAKRGQPPSKKFLSFFRVGGGLTANDYANIRHHTEDKWIPWDPKNPPTDYIELWGGVQYQRERPDVWIKPEDSVVIQAKAASVGTSDEFAANLTLRFPRFQKLRSDKDWTTALSYEEFLEVKNTAEMQKDEYQKKMKAEQRKKTQRTDLRKKPLEVVGYSVKSINRATHHHEGSKPTDVFRGLTFFVMTEGTKPEKKSKLELEEMIKANGGRIIQTAESKPDAEGNPADDVICIASKKSVKVASLIKRGKVPVLEPVWIFDCIDRARMDANLGLPELPLRPELDRHIYFAPEERKEMYRMEVDQYGDSFARDTTVEELRECLSKMDEVAVDGHVDDRLVDLVGESSGWLFRGAVLQFVVEGAKSLRLELAETTVKFGGGKVVEESEDQSITHVVVDETVDPKRISSIRSKTSERRRLPRIVTLKWIEDSWKEKTRLDEELFQP